MRPLRYSINVTLDGCCDHREGIADEELHRHAVGNLDRADAVLFGRVTYEMAGHEPTLFAGLSKPIDLQLVSRLEFGSGAVAVRYEPKHTLPRHPSSEVP